MLGKLLKYELKSTCRTFFLIFIVILLATLMPMFGEVIKNETISIFGYSILMIMIFPIIIIYSVVVINRYQNNLYGEEGYLTFTLPVKSWQIILSKLLAATIWAVATAIVGILACCLMILIISGIMKMPFPWTEIFKALSVNLPFTILLCTLILAGGIHFLLNVYLSISLANLSFIQKANGILAVVFFFVLSFLESKLMSLFPFNHFFENNINTFLMQEREAWGVVNRFLGYSILQEIVFSVIFFLIISYITSKKLHLR